MSIHNLNLIHRDLYVDVKQDLTRRDGMLEVDEISDLSDLADLRIVWNDILGKSKDNNIFSTWEWLSSWWRYFGNGRDLRVLVVRDGGHVLGVAPLMRSTYSFKGIGKIRKIEFIGSPQSDYHIFLLSAKEVECVGLFLNYLVGQSDWDLLQLGDIAEGTRSEAILSQTHTDGSFNSRFRATELCPYIELPGSLDEFMKRLGGKNQRELRRCARRLGGEHRVQFKTYREYGSIEEAMGIFFELHQMRQRSKGELGALAEETVREFHICVAREMALRGWLSLDFLTADDEPVAAIYSFDYAGKKYVYLSGMDPSFSAFSVGNLLHMHLITTSIKDGLREYDFMRGPEQYKLDWAAQVRRNFEFQLAQKAWLSTLSGLVSKSKGLASLVRLRRVEAEEARSRLRTPPPNSGVC